MRSAWSINVFRAFTDSRVYRGHDCTYVPFNAHASSRYVPNTIGPFQVAGLQLLQPSDSTVCIDSVFFLTSE